MIEREKTYLLKKIPTNLYTYPFKKVEDIYIPWKDMPAQIRFRKTNDTYNFTKKCPIVADNRSSQEEQTILIDKEEFNYIRSYLPNKIHKHRYYVPYQELTIEVDVFQDELAWLVMADVEFPDELSKTNFLMPDFCLCEVTQDVTFAGWCLCGKTFKDISKKLALLWYKKL